MERKRIEITEPRLTVGGLIALLQTLPPDLRVEMAWDSETTGGAIGAIELRNAMPPNYIPRWSVEIIAAD